MTGWRALLAAPRGLVSFAVSGPSSPASQRTDTGEIRTHTESCLKRLPLPLGYGAEVNTSKDSSRESMRGVCHSCGGWNRTDGLLVQSQVSLPTATAPQDSFRIGHSRSIRVRDCSKDRQSSLPAVRPRHDFRRERKERESNPQGVLAHARLFSRQLPSPVGLSSHSSFPLHWQQNSHHRHSCGGRIRTCNRLLNRELPYRWATPH